MGRAWGIPVGPRTVNRGVLVLPRDPRASPPSSPSVVWLWPRGRSHPCWPIYGSRGRLLRLRLRSGDKDSGASVYLIRQSVIE